MNKTKRRALIASLVKKAQAKNRRNIAAELAERDTGIALAPTLDDVDDELIMSGFREPATATTYRTTALHRNLYDESRGGVNSENFIQRWHLQDGRRRSVHDQLGVLLCRTRGDRHRRDLSVVRITSTAVVSLGPERGGARSFRQHHRGVSSICSDPVRWTARKMASSPQHRQLSIFGTDVGPHG